MQNFNIKVIANDDNNLAKQCKELAKEKQFSIGGEKAVEKQFRYTNYLVCAVKEGEVEGYVALKKSYFKEDDLFMLQFVLKNNEDVQLRHELMQYVRQHSLGYYGISIKVEKYYKNIDEFFFKYGFRRSRQLSNYYYKIETRNILENNPLQLSEEIEQEI